MLNLCAIHKWFISRNLDTGKPLAKRVSHHIQHCPSCRSFSRFSLSLDTRMSDDLQDFLDSPVRTPSDRIVRTRRPVLHSLIAATAALSAVVLVLTLVNGPGKPAGSSAPLDPFSTFNRTSLSLEKTLTTAGSPLEKEFNGLKQTVIFTSEFLRSRLDIKIGSD